MNDYIFPEVVLAALVAVAGTAASVNAAIAGGPTHVRMSIDAEVFRQDFGQVQPSQRIAGGGGEESIDLEEIMLVSGEPEVGMNFNPIATGHPLVYPGGFPPDPIITAIEYFNRSQQFLFDGKGTSEFTTMARFTDNGGAIYVSQSALVFTANARLDGRRDSVMMYTLTSDAIFSNGGDIEWILAAGSQLRMYFVPAPAAVTPLLAGLVAVRRRR